MCCVDQLRLPHKRKIRYERRVKPAALSATPLRLDVRRQAREWRHNSATGLMYYVAGIAPRGGEMVKPGAEKLLSSTPVEAIM